MMKGLSSSVVIASSKRWSLTAGDFPQHQAFTRFALFLYESLCSRYIAHSTRFLLSSIIATSGCIRPYTRFCNALTCGPYRSDTWNLASHGSSCSETSRQSFAFAFAIPIESHVVSQHNSHRHSAPRHHSSSGYTTSQNTSSQCPHYSSKQFSSPTHCSSLTHYCLPHLSRLTLSQR